MKPVTLAGVEVLVDSQRDVDVPVSRWSLHRLVGLTLQEVPTDTVIPVLPQP